MATDRRRRERLDRLWDAIVAATPATESPAAESESEETLRWFQAMAEPPAPAEARARGRAKLNDAIARERQRRRSRAVLMLHETEPAPASQIDRNGEWPRPAASPPASSGAGRRMVVSAGAFAVLLLIVAAALVVYLRSDTNTADQPDGTATPVATTPPDAWPMFRGNAARTGATSEPGPTGPLATWWTFKAPLPLNGPVVMTGSVYAVSQAGVVYAVDAKTGLKRWEFDTGAIAQGNQSYPAADRDSLYVASLPGVVSALDAANGAERWSYATGAIVVASPLLVDDTLYVADGEGVVHALAVADGTARWRIDIGAGIDYSAMASSGGRLYVLDGAGMLRALDAGSGETIWSRSIERGRRMLAYADGMLIASGPDVGLRALDAAMGEPRWSFQPGAGALTFGLAVADGRVVAHAGGETVALDLATGATVWSVAHPALGNTLTIAGDAVYAAETGGAIVALDLTTGAEVGRGAVGGEAGTGPSAAAGVLYVAAGSGALTALTVSEGIPAVATLAPTAAPAADQPPAVVATFLWSASNAGMIASFAPGGALWVVEIFESGAFSIFDRDGGLIESWGRLGKQPGEFDFQIPGQDGWWGDFAFGRDGSLYVAECGNARVQQFDARRNLVRSWGTFGLGPGQLHCPSGIVVLPDGDIVVSDVNRGDIQRFGPDGAFKKSLGRFRSPLALNLDAEGNLVFAEPFGGRIKVITPEGAEVLTFGVSGAAPGNLFRPIEAALDEAGNYYVVDEFLPWVSVFDPTGAFIGVFGASGAGDGQFNGSACGVAYGGRGSLYVTDCGEPNRVQKFKVEITAGPSAATPSP